MVIPIRTGMPAKTHRSARVFRIIAPISPDFRLLTKAPTAMSCRELRHNPGRSTGGADRGVELLVLGEGLVVVDMDVAEAGAHQREGGVTRNSWGAVRLSKLR
jgi:hypothetical protein